jgi:hypothetical protein
VIAESAAILIDLVMLLLVLGISHIVAMSSDRFSLVNFRSVKTSNFALFWAKFRKAH